MVDSPSFGVASPARVASGEETKPNPEAYRDALSHAPISFVPPPPNARQVFTTSFRPSTTVPLASGDDPPVGMSETVVASPHTGSTVRSNRESSRFTPLKLLPNGEDEISPEARGSDLPELEIGVVPPSTETESPRDGTLLSNDGSPLAAANAAALIPSTMTTSLPGVARTNEPIRPIPLTVGVDSDKVALGRALFHDPRLSKDNTTACVSCHDLGAGGDDGLRVSVGVEGRLGPINAPTVLNVGLNFKQFWDGRASTLDEQIDGPVQSSFEMGSLWPEVMTKLQSHDLYPARFKSLYPDGINRKNVKDALAEFMRSLTTPNSRFDLWLKGDDSALTERERQGYALFKRYGCVSCHQGANVGGNMFQVFDVLNEYFKRRGNMELLSNLVYGGLVMRRPCCPR